MDRKRLTTFIVGFGILIILVIFLFARSSIRSAGRIQLPQEDNGAEDSNGDGANTTGLDLVAVTPETVQEVVATMERLEAYSRTVTVTTIWNGGSQTTEAVVSQLNGQTRIDTKIPGGGTRHVLTDGEITCIWYDSETDWAEYLAGDFTSDREQRIPTYEDLLQYPVDAIQAAEYGEYSGVYCIAVTTEDDGGYTDGWWISVSTGLLVAAETYYEGELVYRMNSLTVDTTSPAESLFLLPDGSSLG